MNLDHYIPTNAVTLDPRPPKPKKRKTRLRGITFPSGAGQDTGIVRCRSLAASGTRYRLWYRDGTKRHYVILPVGTTIEQARVKRDNLFRNLKELHGARPRKLRESEVTRKPRTTPLSPDLFIYERPGFIVKILGKQIGQASTREDARAIRDKWIAENPEKVPHLTNGGGAA